MRNITSREKFLKKVYEYSQGIIDYIGLVDYTMLGLDTTEGDIIGLCKRAKEYGVATVCVRTNMVSLSKRELEGTDIGVTTVISFPEGTNSKEAKLFECEKAIADGADDIDMVLNYQKLKEVWYKIDSTEEEDERKELYNEIYYDLVEEVKALVVMCHNSNKILKVIVESGKLNAEQTKFVTEICIEAGADFIKTSTGMIDVGAELDKIKIMYDTIKEKGSNMLIKASGGIRTIDDIIKFAPYTDRFGVGSGSIDKMMGVSSDDSTY